MLVRILVPITAIVLAGCGRQPDQTYAANAFGPGQPPAPAVSNAPAPAQPATDIVPAARPNPIVSAEPADTPSARTSRPSAFAPRTRTMVHREAAETREPSVVIPAGTRIEVRLAQTLDTKTAHTGDRFSATLDNPIMAGNRVIVPRGTPFEGTVEQSKSSGRFRGRAVMIVRLRSFRLNGATYRIATSPDTAVSGNHKKRNLAFMGGGPAAGAGIGALAGGGAGALIGAGAGAVAGTTTAFITGKKNVKLPVESRMVFSLQSGVPLRRS